MAWGISSPPFDLARHHQHRILNWMYMTIFWLGNNPRSNLAVRSILLLQRVCSSSDAISIIHPIPPLPLSMPPLAQQEKTRRHGSTRSYSHLNGSLSLSSIHQIKNVIYWSSHGDGFVAMNSDRQSANQRGAAEDSKEEEDFMANSSPKSNKFYWASRRRNQSIQVMWINLWSGDCVLGSSFFLHLWLGHTVFVN